MEDQFMQEIRKIFLAQAESQGRIEDVDSFMEEFDKIFTPKDYLKDGDYNGFSREQMEEMIYSPLEAGCPIQLRHLTDEEIAQIPFIRAILHLMNALNEKEIKLTPKGSLPMKIVSEIYELGPHSDQSDYYERKTEENIYEVRFLRSVLKTIGLIKVRTGKLSLTAKGKKLLAANPNVLVRTIIMFFFTDYNTGWYDNGGSYEVGNFCRLYSLWLLHHYGAQWCSMRFLTGEYFKAFPTLGPEDKETARLYRSRIFFNFFIITGLCEINGHIPYGAENWMDEVRKTPALDLMFSFEEPAQKAAK